MTEEEFMSAPCGTVIAWENGVYVLGQDESADFVRCRKALKIYESEMKVMKIIIDAGSHAAEQSKIITEGPDYDQALAQLTAARLAGEVE